MVIESGILAKAVTSNPSSMACASENDDLHDLFFRDESMNRMLVCFYALSTTDLRKIRLVDFAGYSGLRAK